MKADILLVDDDRLLQTTLASVLEEAGYAVRTASDGAAALKAVRAKRPDLVLMDVMMPKKDGLTACRELRATDAALPIVFLTSLETAEDELVGLAAGGDIYIPKTTPDEVLLARLAAVFRRRVSAEEPTREFMFGNWRVRASALLLEARSGRTVSITERELYFLRLLAEHPGEVFSREAIIARLWGSESEIEDNTLSVFLYALRRKLGKSGDLIVVVRGVGYAYRP